MNAANRTPIARQLTEADARALTESIKRDAQALWMQLLRAFEGRAHVVLGYSSWHAYCAFEFQFGQSQAYRLIDAARVVELIEPDSPMGERTIESERVAREFTPLLSQPALLKEVHAEAMSSAPKGDDGRPKVTARQVSAVVERRRSPAPAGPLSHGTDAPPPEDLAKLVRSLRAAIECAPEAALPALARLKEEAARGLYSPATSDPHLAFVMLLELVATLLERLS